MKLKEFRATKNLTQEKFAQKIGFTLSMVSKIEMGKCKASRNFIEKVKQVYPEINIVEIFFTE